MKVSVFYDHVRKLLTLLDKPTGAEDQQARRIISALRQEFDRLDSRAAYGHSMPWRL